MSAIFGPILPDVITTSQTWSLTDKAEASSLLNGLLGQMYAGDQLVYADCDDEWSGSGVYRLQIRLNRPSGRPLYSLKWEGPV